MGQDFATSKWPRRAIAVLLAIGLWQIGSAAYIHLKAELAQYLLARAWSRTLAGKVEAKPWPWADTWPVARLTVPGQHIDLYVLAGASGRTMAFGPGHLTGTPMPGQPGNSVLSAHRDTHFQFLQNLKQGSNIQLETKDGAVYTYRVTTMQVVDKHDTWVLRDSGSAAVTLITCYPFGAVVPGGPLRFVARSELVRN